ncbi:MAG: CPBP family intramembrane glutamic endopeptidase [Bacillota bacterium]
MSRRLLAYAVATEGFLLVLAWLLGRLVAGGDVFARILPGPGVQPLLGSGLTGHILLGLAGAAGSAAVVLAARAHWRVYRESVDPIIDLLFSPLSLGALVVLSLAAGLAEELFFRGVLQEVIGLVPAAALFAFLHWGFRKELWGYGLTAFFLGLILGAVYQWTSALLAPMVVHAGYNVIVSVKIKTSGGWGPIRPDHGRIR